jgi:hypothetical protein
MIKQLAAIAATLALLSNPAGATPERFEVVNPDEPMIVLPAFPELGASRLSTVEWCSEVVGKTYDQLITDSDFASYESCMREHT